MTRRLSNLGLAVRLLAASQFLSLSIAFAQESPMPKADTPVSQLPDGTLQTVDDLRRMIEGKESSPADLRAVADKLQAEWGTARPPEHVRMLIAIARGGQMGGEDGWFGPAASRYSWNWLATRHAVPPDGSIDEKTFRGPANLFRDLDRNGDGRITADDLDWSDDHPDVERAALAHRFFRRLDQRGEGRVTRDDLLKFFDKAADGKEYLRSGDLRRALLFGASAYLPGDAPTPPSLLKGLFSNELGSLHEGPALDAPAPDFVLKTHDGRREVRLSDEIGRRPVVLMFGNFTCGPFRSHLPVVEELHDRYRDRATFLGVYVREAHPTDGWHMESNARMGVKLPQPTTYAERVAVAGQCHARLHYSMPLLVDELDDRVGNAYSGMPARLYVIDTAGKIAYKAGRGPFGLKPGEMEQALLMLLLDEQGTAEAPAAK